MTDEEISIKPVGEASSGTISLHPSEGAVSSTSRFSRLNLLDVHAASKFDELQCDLVGFG